MGPHAKIRPDSSSVISRQSDSVPSWHKKVHQTCRCAEPCAPRSWLRHAACPARISSPGAGAGAGHTCWMSSSSCSRCSRETLYCSSRTSAKYSVHRIDSFSFTVRMMSCHTERRGDHLRSRLALRLRPRTGRSSLAFPPAPRCSWGERGWCSLGPTQAAES